MKQLLKNFIYGLLPYCIFGVIVGLFAAYFRHVHYSDALVIILSVIVSMVALNIAVNVAREVIEKREKIEQARNATRRKK
jgi:1,4-dihydroxy-2-naphthoate octaprenyltransferase